MPFPKVDAKTACQLFADDASRDEDGGSRHVSTYSVVGIDWKRVASVNAAVGELKQRLEPSRNPIDWAFHMTVLRSGQQRRKHAVFASWSLAKVVSATDALFELIANSENLLVYSIGVVTRKGASFTQKAKRQAFLALVMKVIDDITDQKAQPQFFFDAEKPTKGPHTVHGWAEKLFFDSQHCYLYPFLAKCIEIPEPQFIEPASHPGLELADFVGFVVARAYYDRWRKKQPELDPARLGRVTYLGFEPDGTLVFSLRAGIPWDLFAQ